MAKTTVVPVSLLEKITAASEAFHQLEDELEDFLISQDEDLLSRPHQARQEHLADHGRPSPKFAVPSDALPTARDT